jgi:WD40 repeat protein
MRFFLLVLPLLAPPGAQDPSPEAQRLVERLGSEQIEDRQEAARQLKLLGPPAVPSLTAAAKDPDSEVSSRAQEVLRQIEVGELLILKTDRGRLNSVSFSSDGKLLASGSSAGTVVVWDVALGREARTLSPPFAGADAVVFAPQGYDLACCGWKCVWIVNASTGREGRTLTGHSRSVRAVSFSPDGRRLASVSQEYGDQGLVAELKIWDAAGGKEIRGFTGPWGWFTSVGFHPEREILVTGSTDGLVRLWEVGTGREIRSLAGHAGGLGSVAVCRNGKILASRGLEVKIWDPSDGREVATLVDRSAGPSGSLAISPDGRRLALGGADREVHLWSIPEKRLLRSYPGHLDTIGGVAFSPDGRVLASSSYDGSVRLWRVGD